MRNLLLLLLLFAMLSCSEEKKPVEYKGVKITTIYQDSLSIRAIEIMGNSLAFAANKGAFGSIDLNTNTVRANVQEYDTIVPAFRAVAATSTDFFMLSLGTPALLYKTGDTGKMELVYKEEGETVFYDSMTFWNDKEGIAVGDSVDGCLSIIITRDGGTTWQKLPCSSLPKGTKEEGAFAASNTNIKVVGDKAWIATTASRIYYTDNKGKTWSLFETPISGAEPTAGIYSIDFYNKNIGFAIGGDYTKPENNTANKTITLDGGKTWELVANGDQPGYKSCVQFVPNSNGDGLVAIGFTGISYSNNGGASWKQFSDESFYTLRFLNDSIAYAAGQHGIAKLNFY